VRDLRLLDAHRIRSRATRDLYGWDGDETCGAFLLRSSIDGGELIVIASAGEGWDHVSVSRRNRCPNWPEMEQVKRAFFRDDETAMQLHVPQSDHVNNHPYALHMWRPLDREIPRPPSILVGIGNAPVESAEEAREVHRKAIDEVNRMAATPEVRERKGRP
jgi:hypothetical protein